MATFARGQWPDDSASELWRRRSQNDQRLKSLFESIFAKYERDFDGIGDEIDLETGQVVVNNGHLLGMQHEKDAGDGQDYETCSEDYSSSDKSEIVAVEEEYWTTASEEGETSSAESLAMPPDMVDRWVVPHEDAVFADRQTRDPRWYAPPLPRVKARGRERVRSVDVDLTTMTPYAQSEMPRYTSVDDIPVRFLDYGTVEERQGIPRYVVRDDIPARNLGSRRVEQPMSIPRHIVRDARPTWDMRSCQGQAPTPRYIVQDDIPMRDMRLRRVEEHSGYLRDEIVMQNSRYSSIVPAYRRVEERQGLPKYAQGSVKLRRLPPNVRTVPHEHTTSGIRGLERQSEHDAGRRPGSLLRRRSSHEPQRYRYESSSSTASTEPWIKSVASRPPLHQPLPHRTLTMPRDSPFYCSPEPNRLTEWKRYSVPQLQDQRTSEPSNVDDDCESFVNDRTAHLSPAASEVQATNKEEPLQRTADSRGRVRKPRKARPRSHPPITANIIPKEAPIPQASALGLGIPDSEEDEDCLSISPSDTSIPDSTEISSSLPRTDANSPVRSPIPPAMSTAPLIHPTTPSSTSISPAPSESLLRLPSSPILCIRNSAEPMVSGRASFDAAPASGKGRNRTSPLCDLAAEIDGETLVQSSEPAEEHTPQDFKSLLPLSPKAKVSPCKVQTAKSEAKGKQSRIGRNRRRKREDEESQDELQELSPQVKRSPKKETGVQTVVHLDISEDELA